MINRTTQFIMPLLFPYNYNDYFNCYLGLNKLKDVEGNVYCVAKKDIPIKILTTIKNYTNYIGSTFVNKKQILILNIPDKYQDDYIKFLVGNYKLININTKRIIYKFWFDNYKQNNIFANITNKILFSLFDDIQSIENLTDSLSILIKDYDEIFKIIKNNKEVESILKISEEIYKTD